MEDTKRLDIFYDALKDEYKSYIEDVVKSLGFLIVALGWIMTSDSARTFLCEPRINIVAVICTIVLTACNMTVYIGHYLRSKRLKQQILICDPEADELVTNYFLRPAHIALNSITIGGLFALLIVLIWLLKIK